MQNNQDKNWNNHFNDILTREWKNDFASLTNAELTLLLQNVFYQLFLIEINSVEISSKQNEFGNFVKFEISGEAFRDPEKLEEFEKEDLYSQNNMYNIDDEEYNED